MLLIIALLLTLPLAHFFANWQKRSKERTEQEEQDRRRAFLEAVLENSKDRI
jgi:hypothetical protein